MSLREQSLQKRVDALEESFYMLISGIRANLPSMYPFCDSISAILKEKLTDIEKDKALAVNLNRISMNINRSIISPNDIRSLLSIITRELLNNDNSSNYLTKVNTTYNSSLSNTDTYELDITHTLKNNINISEHSKLVCRYECHPNMISVGSLEVSGRDIVNGEIVVYNTGYDTFITPIYNQDMLNWMNSIFSELLSKDHPLQSIGSIYSNLTNIIKDIRESMIKRLDGANRVINFIYNDIRKNRHYVQMIDGVLRICVRLVPIDNNNFNKGVKLTIDLNEINDFKLLIESDGYSDRTKVNEMTALEVIKLKYFLNFLSNYIINDESPTEYIDQNNDIYKVTEIDALTE